MDFALTDDQQQLQALAARLFDDLSGHEQLQAHEAGGEPLDSKLWVELAKAGLLGLSLPEALGGGGLGFVESALVLQEAGRHTAPVPLAAAVCAGMALAALADPATAERWVPEVAAGTRLVTVAIEEPVGAVDRSDTTVRRDGDGWVVAGTKAYVPWGEQADALLVSAAGPDGPTLVLVAGDAAGVARTGQLPTSGRPEALVALDDVRVGADAVLGGPAGAAGAAQAADGPVRWVADRLATACCLEIAGACQAALALTAEHTARRQQFGKAIATFQAVGQRAADAYVDTEAVRLTAWQAAWRLDAGLPAAEEVAIASFWADDGAQRVVHACQHLHGGMGVDRDYPLHRTYLLVKHLATRVEGATASLLRLGGLLAGAG